MPLAASNLNFSVKVKLTDVATDKNDEEVFSSDSDTDGDTLGFFAGSDTSKKQKPVPLAASHLNFSVKVNLTDSLDSDTDGDDVLGPFSDSDTEREETSPPHLRAQILAHNERMSFASGQHPLAPLYTTHSAPVTPVGSDNDGDEDDTEGGACSEASHEQQQQKPESPRVAQANGSVLLFSNNGRSGFLSTIRNCKDAGVCA